MGLRDAGRAGSMGLSGKPEGVGGKGWSAAALRLVLSSGQRELGRDLPGLNSGEK